MWESRFLRPASGFWKGTGLGNAQMRISGFSLLMSVNHVHTIPISNTLTSVYWYVARSDAPRARPGGGRCASSQKVPRLHSQRRVRIPGWKRLKQD
ncbi:hypothetical protein AOLI_G00289210 [Acnodon oligacanthus]